MLLGHRIGSEEPKKDAEAARTRQLGLPRRPVHHHDVQVDIALAGCRRHPRRRAAASLPSWYSRMISSRVWSCGIDGDHGKVLWPTSFAPPSSRCSSRRTRSRRNRNPLLQFCSPFEHLPITRPRGRDSTRRRQLAVDAKRHRDAQPSTAPRHRLQRARASSNASSDCSAPASRHRNPPTQASLRVPAACAASTCSCRHKATTRSVASRKGQNSGNLTRTYLAAGEDHTSTKLHSHRTRSARREGGAEETPLRCGCCNLLKHQLTNPTLDPFSAVSLGSPCITSRSRAANPTNASAIIDN